MGAGCCCLITSPSDLTDASWIEYNSVTVVDSDTLSCNGAYPNLLQIVENDGKPYAGKKYKAHCTLTSTGYVGTFRIRMETDSGTTETLNWDYELNGSDGEIELETDVLEFTTGVGRLKLHIMIFEASVVHTYNVTNIRAYEV